MDCPQCGKPTDNQYCTSCGVQWHKVIIDRDDHEALEIDPSLNYRVISLGALTVIYYLAGERICRICGEGFPEPLTACPRLVKLAAKMYLDPQYGSSTHQKALDFLEKEQDTFKYWLSHAPDYEGKLIQAIHASDLLKRLGL